MKTENRRAFQYLLRFQIVLYSILIKYVITEPKIRGVGLNEHSMAKKENRCAQKSNKSIHGYILDICICNCSPGIVSVETKEMQ